jgi:alkylation response protein AidB-like acyl-CoA dehydrogenase
MMDFTFNKEQRMIQKASREFAQKEILPIASDLEEGAVSPQKIIRKMAELDLLGIMVPQEAGGTGFDAISYILAVEEIAAADAGMAVSYSNLCALIGLFLAGASEGQRGRYLSDLIDGRKIGALGFMEGTAGSETAEMETVAQKAGPQWNLRGEKCFAINGTLADFYLIYAKTQDGAGEGSPGLLIVERGQEGVHCQPVEDSMGIRSAGLANIGLRNVPVPPENFLGGGKEVPKLLVSYFDELKVGAAAVANGLSRGALQAAVAYSKKRIQFGRPICEFQAIANKLADMEIFLSAAQWLTYQAAFTMGEKANLTKEAAQAKVFASESAYKVCHGALQIHGGYGFVKDYPIEKYYRDQRVLEIYAETNEINRNIIAKRILK